MKRKRKYKKEKVQEIQIKKGDRKTEKKRIVKEDKKKRKDFIQIGGKH